MTFIPDESALCAQVDPDVWFPTRTLDGEPTTSTLAVALCRTCPLLTPCAEYALHNDVDGVWGATTKGQRQKLRRQTGVRATPILGWSQTDDAIRLREQRAVA